MPVGDVHFWLTGTNIFHMYETLGVISDVSAQGRKEQMFNANRQHGMANQFALQKKRVANCAEKRSGERNPRIHHGVP